MSRDHLEETGIFIHFESFKEGRRSEEFGPFKWAQITDNQLRVSIVEDDHSDVELATYNDEGWVLPDNSRWSDIFIFHAPRRSGAFTLPAGIDQPGECAQCHRRGKTHTVKYADDSGISSMEVCNECDKEYFDPSVLEGQVNRRIKGLCDALGKMMLPPAKGRS